jgi:hypothetical protein
MEMSFCRAESALYVHGFITLQRYFFLNHAWSRRELNEVEGWWVKDKSVLHIVLG